MVQGLAFLSKKSWHTKNKAVQEKVWVAEERDRAEKKKTSELARQIQQEREEADLAKIAGHSKKLDKGIDWMYSGQNKDSETAKEDAAKKAEEYLLGKEFTGGDGKVQGDLDAGGAHEGVNAVVTAATAADDDVEQKKPSAAAIMYAEDSVAQRNEAFRMRHEDPMFAVSMQAVQKERKLEQRKELYEKAGIAVKEIGKDETRSNNNKKKKRKKKDKMKKKHHHRSRREYDSDDSYERRSSKRRRRHHHRRDRSDSSDDDEGDSYVNRHRHRRKKSRNYHHDRREDNRYQRSRSRSRSRSWSTANSYRSYDKDNDSRDWQYKQDNDDSRLYDDGYRRKLSPRSQSFSDGDDDAKKGRSAVHQQSQYQRHTEDWRVWDRSPSPAAQQKADGYGLQGTAAAAAAVDSRRARYDDLGPNRNLLEQKRQAQEAERRRLYQSKTHRRHQTAEERQQALRAMERDAAVHSTARDRNLHRNDRHQDDGSAADEKWQEASFLDEMKQRAHGVSGDHNIFMSERLRQNWNINQRPPEEFL